MYRDYPNRTHSHDATVPILFYFCGREPWSKHSLAADSDTTNTLPSPQKIDVTFHNYFQGEFVTLAKRTPQLFPGFYNLVPGFGCSECGCNSEGSASIACDGRGACECKENVVGSKCNTCAMGSFGLSEENPSGKI
eukprot:sb/3474648/